MYQTDSLCCYDHGGICFVSENTNIDTVIFYYLVRNIIETFLCFFARQSQLNLTYLQILAYCYFNRRSSLLLTIVTE